MLSQPILIGVSSCLLGERVRFDGGHKRDPYIAEVLSDCFHIVPVCPEAEIGMGVPRNSVRLEGSVEAPRMIDNVASLKWTSRMNRYAVARVRRRDLASLSGFILKERSPSCGKQRVKLYEKSGVMSRRGRGLFARTLMNRFPDLPIEEEGRMADIPHRDSFIVRVFAYDRLRRLLVRRFSCGRMTAFHGAHKFLLLAHNPVQYRELTRLVDDIKSYTPADFKQSYQALFMKILKYRSTIRKNVRVLEQIAKQLESSLGPIEKPDIRQAITDYGAQVAPLVVPITLLDHLARKYEVDHVRGQVYLRPDPRELMLRNHA